MSKRSDRSFFGKKFQLTVSVVFIVVVTCGSYWNSLGNGFTNWDDDKYVTQSIVIKDLSWKNIGDMFTGFYVSNYHPLTLLTYAVEYHFFGLDPSVYHVTNLILHLSNSVLVFWLLLILSGEGFISLVGALLFGIHPLHVESVAWVSERKDVLSTLFFLQALILYLYYRKRKARKYYYFSLFTFVLSLLAKPMAVSLPFVLMLCDYLSNRSFNKKALTEKAPFFVITAAFAIITILAQRGAIRQEHAFGPVYNVFMASYGVVFYLIKTVAPVKLSCLYPYPPEKGLPLTFLVSPIIVAILAALVVFSRKYSRKVIFGSLFFSITILPVLQIVPIGNAIVADRYMYIPSVGLFYLAGVAFHAAYTRKIHFDELKNMVLTFFLAMIIAVFSILTWQRNKVWHDSVTLWGNVVINYPYSGIAQGNLGLAYAHKGLHSRAITQYEKALAIDPQNTGIYNNLGLAYGKKGLHEQGISHFKKALEIDPRCVAAYCNLGNAYSEKGLYEEAISEFEKALQIDPYDLKALNSLGLVYGKKHLHDEAISQFKKALEIDPRSADTHCNLGNAYLGKGTNDKAFSHLKKAVEIDPRNVKALNSLGIAYGKTGQYEKAILQFKQALQVDPQDRKAHNNLGVAYGRQGLLDQAIFHFRKVLEIDPSDQKALKNLERIHRRKRSGD